MNDPRPYRDERDIQAMCNLLMDGRKANNGSYYVHPGDLKWWLYYPPLEGNFWEHIYLWEDPVQPEKLLGWALISPDWVGYDVYVQPELRGCLQAEQMYLWGEQQALACARVKSEGKVKVFWILDTDAVLDEFFQRHAYQRMQEFVHMTRSLEETIPSPQVPVGFVVRGCRGEEEVIARARSQYGAFNSSAHFEPYLERFSNFIGSPVYDVELDIVAVNEDGMVGAFSIVWTDPVNQVGLFEPVGTHPDFRQKGLGRAVIMEGLRRLQGRGMKTAIVSTPEDNLAAIRLYESAGFQVVNRFGAYEKDA